MQTSKTKNGPSAVPHKTSPITPKSSRAAKATRSGFDSANSKLTPTNSSTERSPKVVDRRSPKSPTIEKKRPISFSELSSEVTRLEEELKKMKEQLRSSESSNQQLQQEADEINKQLAAKSANFNKLQLYFSALSSAQQQLDVMKSETAQAGSSEMAKSELETLKEEMEDTLSAIEDLQIQNRERGLAEAAAKFIVFETQKQLEIANAAVKDLRADGRNLMESLSSVTSKLEESRVRADALEELAAEYQEAVEDSKLERRNSYNKEPIRIASELVKFNAGMRESELKYAIERAKTELSGLKERVFDVEREVQMISETNDELREEMKKEEANQFGCELKLMKAETDATELKAKLLDKEKALQSILEQNEKLNSELRKREHRCTAAIDEAVEARGGEKEALRRIGLVEGEAEKSSKRAMEVLEHVEEANLVNLEMETEIKKLKVQADQWRKAAEAASAILAAGNNGGRAIEVYDNISFSGKLTGSPFSGDLDDELLKMEKKNSSVLRKLGGLWKKSLK